MTAILSPPQKRLLRALQEAEACAYPPAIGRGAVVVARNLSRFSPPLVYLGYVRGLPYAELTSAGRIVAQALLATGTPPDMPPPDLIEQATP